MNKTDHDSRMMRTERQPTVQGYNAQVPVTRGQIIVAAEMAVESPDFGHLEPTVRGTARAQPRRCGTPARDRVGRRRVLAQGSDGEHGQRRHRGPRPSRRRLREGARPGWDKGLYAFMRRVLAGEAGHELYRHRKATVEPAFAQIKFNRKISRFQRRGRAAGLSEWGLSPRRTTS
jgi:hypothetical protein